ncbi:MAG: calcium/sodium antiporter [Muribaculaceae bacterium]|nr:calcium/sodium antiporter [Muribaculaceae bacterium]
MILSIVYLVLGLVLILVGANALTDGASAIARRSGISELVIGLTIVAFGTSAPELVITVVSAAQGNTELALGNVVGSNIFNILVIIGVTSMIKPMHIGSSVMTNELPMVLLSSLAILIMGNSIELDGSQESVLTRTDGLILLLFFAIFMRYTFSQARHPRADQENMPSGEPEKAKGMGLFKAWIWLLGGLGMLIFGGDKFVDGASAVARAMGVSDAVIGLTIVSIGTSLPELATSVTAAIKGQPGIALGNVIGSNIFNVFFVGGVGAVVRPLQFGAIGNVDLLVLTGASLLFWLFVRIIGHNTITRGEGALLFLCYAGYMVWLVVNA